MVVDKAVGAVKCRGYRADPADLEVRASRCPRGYLVHRPIHRLRAGQQVQEVLSSREVLVDRCALGDREHLLDRVIPVDQWSLLDRAT